MWGRQPAAPWGKWSYEPVRSWDVPAAFMRAFAIAMQPPAGPVFLSIPLDDWDKPASGPAVLRSIAHRFAPDEARISEFAERLSQAKNPALIYGAAIARGDGWKQAIALAEKLQAHVFAAPASERPPFPESHPLYAGGLPFAMGPLAKKLEGYDVAIVIGAPIFRYYPYVPGPYLPEGLALMHITDDPAEAARAPVGDSLLGDPVLSLESLERLVRRRAAPSAPVVRQSHGMAAHPQAEAVPHSDVLSARQLFDALREACPHETVLVEESPSNLAELHAAWPIDEPDAFYTFASGSLGWGLPASVGIALAERDSGRNRPVVTVIGDGSAQYSIQGLWTAVQQELPIIYVVPCNRQYCILQSFAVLEETPGVPGLEIPGLDYVALAKGYGATGVHARTADEVRNAIAAARRRKGPTMLEVPIQPSVPPLL